MTSKNDTAWESLFEKYNILENIKTKKFFIITSQQINKFRESRLMTKFDHRNNLPELFRVNSLSILPLTRGSYIIGRFEAYEKVNYANIEPIPVNKRDDLESLDYTNIYSESAALNCAFASGIIKDLIGEECVLTINGRMSSKSFEFKIKESALSNQETQEKKIKVHNSQCEIDGGFEGETKLALIEAKNTQCDDFLIRQMYYPYRLWKDKVSKKIIPIFMTYSNDKFSFFIYDFEDPDNYNSLRLIQQKDYIIAPEPISLEDLKEIFSKIKRSTEPKIPFPQADRFDRVVDLLGLLMVEPMTKEEITENYDFDKRQTNYYTSAGMYLGLIEREQDEEKNVRFKLTEKAKKIMSENHKIKNLKLAECILDHEVFYNSFKKYLEISEPPKSDEIVKIMKKSSLYNVTSDSTYKRRSQTILKWIEWVLELVEE